jgi:hypothetical protein
VRINFRDRVCYYQGDIGPSRTRVSVAEFNLPQGTIEPCPGASP